MINIANKTIGITGSQGFIGKYVCKILEKRNAKLCLFEDKTILHNTQSTYQYLKDNKIEYIIHLAGFNGGIEFNKLYPADIFTINTTMALNIISACCKANIKKVLGVITSCAYPEFSNSSENYYCENSLHIGRPNYVVSCHGYAKRNMEIAARMYRQQYGLNIVIACPNTVYGPGDRTDPQRTKVMTALIKKFVDAKINNTPEVICWGTGTPKREFIFVEDAAELLVRTLELYEDGDLPLNISTGQEYSIGELSEIVANKVGYKGNIVWDTSKPDGAMRKALNISRMLTYLGNYPFTPIEQGIEKTIESYENSIS